VDVCQGRNPSVTLSIHDVYVGAILKMRGLRKGKNEDEGKD